MASLLGNFHFAKDRQAYFHARITIHELNNVPMVDGQFKAKWRVDHVHQLATVGAAGSSATHTLSSGMTTPGRGASSHQDSVHERVGSKGASSSTGGEISGRTRDSLALRRQQSDSTLGSQVTAKSGSERDGNSHITDAPSVRWGQQLKGATDSRTSISNDSASMKSKSSQGGKGKGRLSSDVRRDVDVPTERKDNGNTNSNRNRILSGFRNVLNQYSGGNSTRNSKGEALPSPDNLSKPRPQAESFGGASTDSEMVTSPPSSTAHSTEARQVSRGSLEQSSKADEKLDNSNASNLTTKDYAAASTEKEESYFEGQPHPIPSEDKKAEKEQRIPASSSQKRLSSNSTHQQNSHQLPEPRGETVSKTVKDHRVRWERYLEVGVRIPVEKARVTSTGGTATPSSHEGVSQGGAGSLGRSSLGHSGLRKQLSSRDVHSSSLSINTEGNSSNDGASTFEGRDSARDSAASNGAIGALGQSELCISIKADVPTGVDKQQHGSGAGRPTTIRMGFVSINLAEFAPLPHHSHNHHRQSTDYKDGGHQKQSSYGHENQQQQQHNHHHHHHHHPVSRTETRRYLLTDGPTNATLKLTIEMTHVGGLADYSVPHNKCGMLMADATPASLETSQQKDGIMPKGGGSSSDSDAGSIADGYHGERSSTRQSQRSTPTSRGAGAFDATQPLLGFSANSVARNQRIPAHNLTSALSHHDTARAIKEVGGGGRLAFSFASGAHHDRAPEDIVDLVFDPKMSPEHLALLTTLGREMPQRKQQSSSSEQKDGTNLNSSAESRMRARSDRDLSKRSRNARASTKPLPRLSLPATASKQEEKYVSRQGNEGVARGGSSGSASSSTPSRVSTVRWNDLEDSTMPPDEKTEPFADTRNTSQLHPSVPSVSSPSQEIAASPMPMSPAPEGTADDVRQGAKDDSFGYQSVDIGAPVPSSDDSQPPMTPPDVARREMVQAIVQDGATPRPPEFAGNVLWRDDPNVRSTEFGDTHESRYGRVSQSHGEETSNKKEAYAQSKAEDARAEQSKLQVAPSLLFEQTLTKRPSRRTLGLTREAALQAGYHGAGWGTHVPAGAPHDSPGSTGGDGHGSASASRSTSRGDGVGEAANGHGQPRSPRSPRYSVSAAAGTALARAWSPFRPEQHLQSRTPTGSSSPTPAAAAR